jgi:hypothetical protein
MLWSTSAAAWSRSIESSRPEAAQTFALPMAKALTTKSEVSFMRISPSSVV